MQQRPELREMRDTDLAGIRDPSSLSKLPKEEWEAVRSLWAHVEAVRERAEADAQPPQK
jgi:hypothetical protein